MGVVEVWDGGLNAEAYTNFLTYLDLGRQAGMPAENRMEAGLQAATKQLSAGIPASFVEEHMPGGDMWERGLATSTAEPISWTVAFLGGGEVVFGL